MLYTVEVYRKDGRTRKGERLVFKSDYDVALFDTFERTVHDTWKGHRVEIYETMVERVNYMTKEKFTERADTPYYCSPRSESYWSM
jgi:hypothetical protein